jgi:outer membrane protein W
MKKLLVLLVTLFAVNLTQAQTSLKFSYVPFQSTLMGVQGNENVNVTSAGLETMLNDDWSLDASLGTEFSEETTLLSIGVGANYWLSPVGAVRPYVGLSVSYGMVDVNESTTYFSVGPRLGFSWEFTDNLSLGGGYSLLYNSTPNTSNTFSTSSLGVSLRVRITN